MTDLRKAAEMALEFLEHVDRFDPNGRYGLDEKIDALIQALAQPEQEPVAWMDKNGVPSTYKSELYSIPLYTLHHSTTQGLIECTHNRYSYDVTDGEATCRDCGAQGRMTFVVNGIAPPSKEWVSLTDEEVWEAYEKGMYEDMWFARAIEAKLKEKNNG